MDRVGPQRHSKNNFVGRNVKSRTVKEFVCNVHVYKISDVWYRYYTTV